MKSDQTVYGRTAVRAVELARTAGLPPMEVWRKAAQEMTRSSTAQKKPCPRSTFLGLCEEGLVKGIPRGSYTTSLDNKAYALKAASVLAAASKSAPSASSLWNAIAGDHIRHNNQMHVVIALFENDLLLLER